MKFRQLNSLLLVLLLCIALSACSSTPAAQPENNDTTTEKETAATTTTTAPATALESAPPSTSLPTEKTSVSKTDPYDPYEVKAPLPVKEKRCLLFDAWGNDIELRFDKAMCYPSDDNAVRWHYVGVAQNGISVTCQVDAEKETIRTIEYGVEAEWGAMTYEDDARTCLKTYLTAHRLPLDAKDARITHTMSAKRGDNGNLYYINWRFSLPLEDGSLSGVIKLANGKLTVCSLSADGDISDRVPLFAPRWKNQ